MKQVILVFLICIVSISDAFAQKDVLTVKGNVRDVFTYEYLSDVCVELLSTDSVTLATDSCLDFSMRYEGGLRELYRRQYEPRDLVFYSLKTRPGNYLMRFTREGYAPLVKPVSLFPHKKGLKDRQSISMDDVFMQPTLQKSLGEAIVRATKIIMVNRGDTVVFNADYFQLAHGNMLDRLLEMLPGLEIKDGGRILYNGNLLSNLLVNGRDFFKGDATMALQNLPAYMVKNLKVYHKEEDDAYLLKADPNDERKPNTLDVVLKKEYHGGWMPNFEVAGGPAFAGKDSWNQAKYLTRLFAMHFNDRSQLSLIGNFNNVSDTKTGKSDGTWDSAWTSGHGVTKLVYGGMDYQCDVKKGDMKYAFSIKGKRTMTDSEQKTSSTSFLQSGDVYRRSYVTEGCKDREVSIGTSLKKRHRSFYLKLPLDVTYKKSTGHGQHFLAQLTEDPEDSYRTACIDSIFSGPSSQRLYEILTNMLGQRTLTVWKEWHFKSVSTLSFKSPLTGYTLRFFPKIDYRHRQGEQFEHYSLQNYPTLEEDKRHRYFNLPSHSFTADVESRYEMEQKLGKVGSWGGFFYYYSRRNESGQQELYNLHLLEEDEPTDLPEWTLPSVHNWRELTMDISNSFHRTVTEDNHKISTGPSFGNDLKKSGVLSLSCSWNLQRHRGKDTRTFQEVGKRFQFFNAELFYQKYWRRQLVITEEHISDGIIARYNFEHEVPPTGYLFDVRDDSRPLAVTLGNAGLHIAKVHNLRLSYSRIASLRKQSVNVDYHFRKTDNAIAMGYSYNPQTGVYTYRPENVDGNWTSSLSVRYNQPFGEQQRWNVTSETGWDYNHSVDIVNRQLSTVRNHGLREKASVFWNMGDRGRISLKATALWQMADSEREDYRRRNTWDLQYGPDLSLKLPHDLHFSTVFSICQRRGYDDRSMNDTELVWDASLNWDFDFRRSSYFRYEKEEGFDHKVAGTGARPWTLRITCHDLLKQLSNTRRVINAQGITETWYNSVPAYVMLHLCYRFTKQPKNRNR